MNRAANPRGFLDLLLTACLGLLVSAAAVYAAVRLIEAVLVPLLILLAVGGFLSLGIGVLRHRNRGW